MKRLMLLLCAVVPALPAEDTSSWAAEWRVTGIMRQGGRAQASIERPGLMARFVKEGDTLHGNIAVLEINYPRRSVTLTDGRDVAVLRVASAMAPPPQPVVVTQQQKQDKNQGSWPNPPEKTTAMQDANGRWHVVFSNGHAMDMQSYVERHGGIKDTFEHVKDRLKQEENPERREFRIQQMRALKAMQKAGMQ
ncbi:MAG: hypothetical protein HZA91_17265 [Verrucomicrobia bacterium]|nr:hypothetical protein [Verrucomicrobiota bacterium]